MHPISGTGNIVLNLPSEKILVPRYVSTIVIVLLLSGCSIPKLSMPKFSMPKLYKVTVQQGNVITQEMVDQLKPGMTRSQVAFIMGEPILRNTFDDTRWDYVYSIVLPGYFEQEARVSLFFEEDALAYFTGDYVPSNQTEDADTGENTSAVNTSTDQAIEQTSSGAESDNQTDGESAPSA